MAVILGKMVDLYHFLNEHISDPRTQDWFLIQSPFPCLVMLGFYLYAVFTLGPRLMQNRKAYSLKHTLIAYNAVQIVACLYIVYQALRLQWWNNYMLVCQPVETENDPVTLQVAWKVCYMYFVVKMVDLLDTVFFVMRKKQGQVTFLHVYHHTGMVCLSWSIVKWLPGGHGTLLIMINSFVHIVMYFYYLLTAFDESYKKSVWWKKHVTQIQIIQFGILFSHFCAVLIKENCGYPKTPSAFLIPQNLFMMLLFCDFYRRAYLVKKPKPS